jgi:hypothetical protein
MGCLSSPGILRVFINILYGNVFSKSSNFCQTLSRSLEQSTLARLGVRQDWQSWDNPIGTIFGQYYGRPGACRLQARLDKSEEDWYHIFCVVLLLNSVIDLNLKCHILHHHTLPQCFHPNSLNLHYLGSLVRLSAYFSTPLGPLYITHCWDLKRTKK